MAQLANAARIGFEALAAALEPPPPVDYLEFVEDNITIGEGAFPGPYSRTLFPYFDAVLQALSPADPCRYVTLQASAQVGKTLIATAFALGSVTLGRGLTLLLHPTEENALRFSKIKLEALMRSTPIVADHFPKRSRDSQSAILFKQRDDGMAALLISGANSPASLSQITVSNLVLDDVAKYESSAAGDPEVMAESRCRAIAEAKIFRISTPLVAPGCRITRSFMEGSQELPYVSCPHCGEMQVLEWSNMLANLDEEHPEAACFTCTGCGCAIEEHHRPALLSTFEWRAQNPSAMSHHRSFWIWSAYSYLQSWEQIAREYLKTKGDPSGEQVFLNDTVGKAYAAHGSGRKWEELRDRAAKSHYPRGTVPEGALVLTLGLDLQMDRCEWLLVGHGRQYRRYIIDCGVIGNHISERDAQN
jgi:phage terminase large subunit GpA-like protein